jgi:vancomycin resistance protein VanJ
MERLRGAAIVWVTLVVAIVVTDVVTPQPFGLSGLGAIFEPYLVASALMAAALVLVSTPVRARFVVPLLVAVALLRYGPAWVSAPPEPADSDLSVSAWNMLAGRDAADRVIAGAGKTTADLVAIEELSQEAATALGDALADDGYTLLAANRRFPDVGLLSRFPVLEWSESASPPLLRAVVQVPSGEQIVVFVVHAPLGRFVKVGDLIVSVDLSVRDKAMALIRARIDVDLALDRTVIVLGDLNTTEREPAYAVLSANLRDAHLDAGTGPGLSWRPGPLSFVPFGLLRIDYVLSTTDLQPTSATVDCSVPSDHCRLDTRLRWAPPLNLD